MNNNIKVNSKNNRIISPFAWNFGNFTENFHHQTMNRIWSIFKRKQEECTCNLTTNTVRKHRQVESFHFDLNKTNLFRSTWSSTWRERVFDSTIPFWRIEKNWLLNLRWQSFKNERIWLNMRVSGKAVWIGLYIWASSIYMKYLQVWAQETRIRRHIYTQRDTRTHTTRIIQHQQDSLTSMFTHTFTHIHTYGREEEKESERPQTTRSSERQAIRLRRV